ncbi:hypothetical protein [Dyella kyungheensis]|jgi:hypothetical protein|uniref:DUF3015 domain-containing protein n=1 Tax=Dyella kyungheensis TaxID=1242174 RepID=A0ABS2JV46_9GAMM|nr:hypothetical protein [Dyella kyungheensis]MBM7122338.1 hypothetical protein [Dyella kyungheensis]
MKGWIRKTWVSCVVAASLGVPLAHAAGTGTITFVGAIVVPTCNTADVAGVFPQRGYQHCAMPAGQASLPTSSYRQDVASLESEAVNHDRLLAYFAGYASSEQTQIVTRTYE